MSEKNWVFVTSDGRIDGPVSHGPTKPESFVMVRTHFPGNGLLCLMTTVIIFSLMNRNYGQNCRFRASKMSHFPISSLQDAARVCREFTEREKGEVRFSAVALCKA